MSRQRFHEPGAAGQGEDISNLTDQARQSTLGLPVAGEVNLGWFKSFISHLPAVAFIKDINGRYLYMNQAYEVMLGMDPAKGVGRFDEELWDPATAETLRLHDRQVLSAGGSLTVREVITTKSGETYHHLVTKFPLYEGGGELVAVGGVALDITRLVRTEDALRSSEERYRIVADYTYDWETWYAPDGAVLYVSPACERITGYPRQRFLEDPAFIETLMHPEDRPLWLRAHKLYEGESEACFLDFRIVRSDGETRWLSSCAREVFDENGRYLGVRTSHRDVTERKLMEDQLRHQAFHDSLTGLPNRTLCLDRIGRCVERSKRRDTHYAVIFLDLDRFKVVNDSLGHAQGDLLLKRVSERLKECVRGLDTVSRLGGDEFAVLVEEVASQRETVRIIKRIRQRLKMPYTLAGRQVHVTASMGIVLSPAIYDRPEDLLRNANIAMHVAKQAGRNRFKVFHNKMLDQAVSLLNMELDLRRALENKEFYLEYQPIVSLQRGEVDGFEALVRWRHPERGVVSPAEFIPVAEDTGLIIPLGQWVLQEACRTMAMWRMEHPGYDAMVMSVNLSAKQLGQPAVVDLVAETLHLSGLPSANLKLEITESAVMDNPEGANQTLKRLKNLGVKLSIDDFGTGYSSLSYLQRFPIDTLKVDRSFVSRMGDDAENKEIVKTVITLAHSLGLDVVAEGVEVDEQRKLLAELSCERFQGFLFSKPVSPEDILQLLDASRLKLNKQE